MSDISKSKERKSRQSPLHSADRLLRALRKSNDDEEDKLKLVYRESSEMTQSLMEPIQSQSQSVFIQSCLPSQPSNIVKFKRDDSNLREPETSITGVKEVSKREMEASTTAEYLSRQQQPEISIAMVDNKNEDSPSHLADPTSSGSNSEESCLQKLASITLSNKVESNLNENVQQVIQPDISTEIELTIINQESKDVKKSASGKKKKTKRKKGESRVRFDPLINEIEIPENETQVNVEITKKKKKKLHKKRLAKTAGKKLWRGVRISCKFLWSGLILYAKPFSSMDLNSAAKAWEEREKLRKRRQYYTYNEPPKTSTQQR